jgi:hypothetical protein
LLCVQFRLRATFPAQPLLAVLPNHIGHIFGMRRREQVIWVDAAANVALVTDA